MEGNVIDLKSYGKRSVGGVADVSLQRRPTGGSHEREVWAYARHVSKQSTVKQLVDQLDPGRWQFCSAQGLDQFRAGYAIRYLNFIGCPWVAYLKEAGGRLDSVTLHYDVPNADMADVWSAYVAADHLMFRKFRNRFQSACDPTLPVLEHRYFSGITEIQLALGLENRELVCEMKKNKVMAAAL